MATTGVALLNKKVDKVILSSLRWNENEIKTMIHFTKVSEN